MKKKISCVIKMCVQFIVYTYICNFFSFKITYWSLHSQLYLIYYFLNVIYRAECTGHSAPFVHPHLPVYSILLYLCVLRICTYCVSASAANADRCCCCFCIVCQPHIIYLQPDAVLLLNFRLASKYIFYYIWWQTRARDNPICSAHIFHSHVRYFIQFGMINCAMAH